MKKKYEVYRRVVIWEQWSLMAADDNEAKKMLDDDDDLHFEDYIIDDPVYLKPDADGLTRFVSDGATTQLLKSNGSKLVWDNTPISVIRNKKLNDIGIID